MLWLVANGRGINSAQKTTKTEESDVSGHNQSASKTVGAEIAGDRVLTREACLEKRWQMIPDRAANVLANLVFVLLILLLFVWVGLWTLVH